MSKLLLYCTKSKPSLKKYDIIDGHYTDTDAVLGKRVLLNGKIVAECDFEVEEINYRSAKFVCNRYYLEILKKSCLTDKQMYDYLKGEKGYAIHIKNLYIFDKPRELSYYYRYCPCSYNPLQPIKVAPQNMMYAYDIDEIKYILISIRPEWLFKILNGEKIIEVRKKVLKEMI